MLITAPDFVTAPVRFVPSSENAIELVASVVAPSVISTRTRGAGGTTDPVPDGSIQVVREGVAKVIRGGLAVVSRKALMELAWFVSFTRYRLPEVVPGANV